VDTPQGAQREKVNNLSAPDYTINHALMYLRPKLYFNSIVYYNLPDYLENRLQRVQKATASFVLGRFAGLDDIIKLKWLPVKEQLYNGISSRQRIKQYTVQIGRTI
jgi:hypothetical protein